MARKQTEIQKLINRNTGVSTSVNGVHGHRVNKGKTQRGKSIGFGSRRDKYRDIRAAFGLSTG